MKNIGYIPINKLRNMISSKEISPVEVMNETFERINSLNSRFGAYITLDEEGSIKKAKEAETAVMKGEDLGPLHGIPVPIKDLEPVKNMRCTFGSIPADTITDEDAISVERIKAAGGIIIGKTTAFGRLRPKRHQTVITVHRNLVTGTVGPGAMQIKTVDRLGGHGNQRVASCRQCGQ